MRHLASGWCVPHGRACRGRPTAWHAPRGVCQTAALEHPLVGRRPAPLRCCHSCSSVPLGYDVGRRGRGRRSEKWCIRIAAIGCRHATAVVLGGRAAGSSCRCTHGGIRPVSVPTRRWRLRRRSPLRRRLLCRSCWRRRRGPCQRVRRAGVCVPGGCNTLRRGRPTGRHALPLCRGSLMINRCGRWPRRSHSRLVGVEDSTRRRHCRPLLRLWVVDRRWWPPRHARNGAIHVGIEDGRGSLRQATRLS